MSLKIITIGAFTQAPRHSTSSQDSVPAAFSWNWLGWIFSWQTAFRSSEPRSMHGVVPQTWTWAREPTGFSWNWV